MDGEVDFMKIYATNHTETDSIEILLNHQELKKLVNSLKKFEDEVDQFIIKNRDVERVGFTHLHLKDCGLIAKPHIYQCEITKNDRFCVIASDGIWDVVNSDDVYNICEREYNCDVIVEKIVNLAIENGSQDNISCIVVALNSYN